MDAFTEERWKNRVTAPSSGAAIGAIAANRKA